MHLSYLGLFETIFNWILDNIFKPVFTFVGNLLSGLFEWLFNNILQPILEKVLEKVFPVLWDLVMEVFGQLLWFILTKLLRLIDVVQKTLDILIGTVNVTYNHHETTLLMALFGQGAFRTAFIFITMIGFVLSFAFAVFAVMKSAFDLDFEGKRPVSQVLKALFKSYIQFLLIPFTVLILISLSGAILKSVNMSLYTSKLMNTFDSEGNNAFKDKNVEEISAMINDEPTLGTIIFLMTAEPANTRGAAAMQTTWANMQEVTTRYDNKSWVSDRFKFSKMDFLIGFGCALFLGWSMIKMLVVFIGRIYDMMMLYIVSPFFTATLPLDDGEMFKKWREMFIGKVFTGFGSAIGLRVFLMLVPVIMAADINFNIGISLGGMSDKIIKVLIIMGGAFTIDKAGPMITGLFSFQARQSEIAAGSAAASAMEAVGDFAKTKYQEFQGGRRARAEVSAQADAEFDKLGEGGGDEGGGGSGNGFSGDGDPPSGGSIGGGGGGLSDMRVDAAKSGFDPSSVGGLAMDGTGVRTAKDISGNKHVMSAGIGGYGVKQEMKDGKARVSEIKLPGLTLKRGADGKMGIGSLNLGFMKLSKGENGKLGVSGVSLGVASFSKGKDGWNADSFNVGVASMKRDKDGKMHISAAGMKFQDTAQGMKFAGVGNCRIKYDKNGVMAGGRIGNKVIARDKDAIKYDTENFNKSDAGKAAAASKEQSKKEAETKAKADAAVVDKMEAMSRLGEKKSDKK